MLIEFAGIIGGFLGVILFIPQIIKTFKTKSVNDLSYHTWLLIYMNVLFWLLYGVVKNDYIIIIPNSIAVFLTTLMLVFFRIYRKI